jgi:hypothetical protein
MAIAVAARIVLLGIALGASDSTTAFLTRSDARAYVAVARMLRTGERPPVAWDERVFWGWPLCFFTLGTDQGLGRTCLVLGVVFASLVPPLIYRLTDNFRLALLLSLFPPSWLMHSCLGMSEPAYLFTLLVAILLFFSGRIQLSGLALALAALNRPTAVFVWMGLAALLVRRRQWGTLLSWAALSALGPAITIGLNGHYYADWFRQAHLHGAPTNMSAYKAKQPGHEEATRTYGSVPFKALLITPLKFPVPAWKIAFIYGHLIAVLTATGLAVRRLGRSEPDFVLGVWAIANTCFIVSTGPYWGFHSFDRYSTWALPAYGYFLWPLVPKRLGALEVLAAASFGMALVGLTK